MQTVLLNLHFRPDRLSRDAGLKVHPQRAGIAVDVADGSFQLLLGRRGPDYLLTDELLGLVTGCHTSHLENSLICGLMVLLPSIID